MRAGDAGFSSQLLHLGLELSDVGAQIAVLGLHGLSMAAGGCASGDAVRRLA